MTPMPASPFMNACAPSLNAQDTAGEPPPPSSPAVTISVSADEIRGCAQSETAVTASVRTVAADPIDHIHEVFAYARHLCRNDTRFVPDRAAIWDAMHDPDAPRARADARVWADEAPLFLRNTA
jgi:hypothetical protein